MTRAWAPGKLNDDSTVAILHRLCAEFQFFAFVQQGSRCCPSFSLLRPLGFSAHALRVDPRHQIMASRFLISASRSIARAAMLAAISPAVAFATISRCRRWSQRLRLCPQLSRPTTGPALMPRASRSFVGPHACRGQSRRDCRAQRADRRRHWRCDARLQLADPAPGLRARRRFRLDERARRRQPA